MKIEDLLTNPQAIYKTSDIYYAVDVNGEKKLMQRIIRSDIVALEEIKIMPQEQFLAAQQNKAELQNAAK